MTLSSPFFLRAFLLTTVFGVARTTLGLGGLEGLSDSFWTYATLGLSSIITEELAPIFGGIAVHEGELRADRVVIALTVGSWIATTLLYVAGRAKWEYLRRRFPRLRSTGTVALRIVQRNPWRASLLVRFVFGFRIILPMACGAAKVHLPVYLIASLLGAAAWSTAFTLVGYAAGEAAMQFVDHLDRVGEIVGAIIVTALILGFVAWRRKRLARKLRRQRRAARGGLPTPISNDAISGEHPRRSADR